MLPIIEWALRQARVSAELQLEWADFQGLRARPTSLVDRVRKATELYPCEVLFIHRDAEAQDPITRHEEIKKAVQQISTDILYVCVVPVRMLEAWLLCDVAAIRKASDNPNGTCQIILPQVKQREKMADPKAHLVKLLKLASELSGRRLKNFDALRARTLIAQNIRDFTPLRQLTSFQSFENEVVTMVEQHHLHGFR